MLVGVYGVYLDIQLCPFWYYLIFGGVTNLPLSLITLIVLIFSGCSVE